MKDLVEKLWQVARGETHNVDAELMQMCDSAAYEIELLQIQVRWLKNRRRIDYDEIRRNVTHQIKEPKA